MKADFPDVHDYCLALSDVTNIDAILIFNYFLSTGWNSMCAEYYGNCWKKVLSLGLLYIKKRKKKKGKEKGNNCENCSSSLGSTLVSEGVFNALCKYKNKQGLFRTRSQIQGLFDTAWTLFIPTQPWSWNWKQYYSGCILFSETNKQTNKHT